MRNFEYNPKDNGQIEQRKSVKLQNGILTLLIIFFIFVSFLALYLTAKFSYSPVDGPSMFPTINAYNTNDNAYYKNNKSAKKGDMIIVNYSFASKNFLAIKRLIATGGDTVCYYQGNILINGEILDEPYLKQGYEYIKSHPEVLSNCSSTTAENWLYGGYEQSKINFERWCNALVNGTMTEENKTSEFFKNYDTKYSDCIAWNDAINSYVLTVPKGFIFFLGDNRKQSSDSSSLGVAEEQYLISKVDFISDETASVFSVFTKELQYMFA